MKSRIGALAAVVAVTILPFTAACNTSQDSTPPTHPSSSPVEETMPTQSKVGQTAPDPLIDKAKKDAKTIVDGVQADVQAAKDAGKSVKEQLNPIVTEACHLQDNMVLDHENQLPMSDPSEKEGYALEGLGRVYDHFWKATGPNDWGNSLYTATQQHGGCAIAPLSEEEKRRLHEG